MYLDGNDTGVVDDDSSSAYPLIFTVYSRRQLRKRHVWSAKSAVTPQAWSRSEQHYAAALTSQDRAAFTNLVHPTSLACISPQNSDYFDFIFAKELSYGAALRGGYSLTRFDPADADSIAASEMGGVLQNPVGPTHQFQIDTPFDGSNRSLTLQRMAVEQGGAWFIVFGCPTAKGLEFFRAHLVEGERQRQRAQELVGALHDPLFSEIRSLLAQNRRIEAIKRYQRDANVDLTTASRVIDIVAAK